MADAGPATAPKDDEENLEVGVEMKLGEEVADVLAEYESTMKNQEGAGYTPNPVFQATKEYVDRFKSLKTREAANTLQKALLEKYQLTEFEKGMLINLAPEEIEEAKILVPSLEDENRFSDDLISEMLNELSTYKTYE